MPQSPLPRRSCGTALLIAATLSLSASAASRTASAQDSGGQAPPEAVERYQRGRDHFRVGRYREAIAELKAALALDPGSPNLTYNVAYVSELAGNVNEAIAYYNKYLALLPKNASEDRDKTRVTLQRLRGHRAQLRHSTRHARREPEASQSSGRADTAFWVSLGGGSTLLAGAAVTGLLALDRENTAAELVISDDDSRNEREHLVDQADSLALTTDILVASGAALIATSALLYFLRSDDSEPTKPKSKTRAAFSTDGRNASLHLQTTF